MKKIYSFLVVCLTAMLVYSCQDEDTTDNVGYLSLAIETNGLVSMQTKAIPANYNPKQIAVEILDASGTVVESTPDWETLGSQPIRLAPGTYIVNASSYNFDGNESGFDIPYYAGSTQVTIKSGVNTTANITCTLANVKVTVKFDQTFIDAFKEAAVSVSSQKEGVSSQNFVMGTTTKSAYFPVGNLSSTVQVTNKNDMKFSQTDVITGVKARDHYILNYKVAETGSVGGVNVTVDGNETIYTFEFKVSTEVGTKLVVSDNVNAWSKFALVEGTIAAIEEGKTLDPAKIIFQYRTADATEWTDAVATATDATNESFTAKLTGLTGNVSYNCRMVYDKGGANEVVGNPVMFTTEEEVPLINGNMDDWYKSGKTWYPISEAYYTAHENSSFWDSSNPGTTTGLGSMINVNPTQGSSTVVHTSGGKSAELKSQFAAFANMGKFAAASLYTGHFVELAGMDGAKIEFGQPFTTRPTQLHGWFQYATGAMDYVGNNTPSELGIVKGTTLDLCSIYIALAKTTYEVDNTDVSTFIDFANDENIIAYGELPASEAVATNGAWKEFTINLKYNNLTDSPAYIIVCCSASKYGDYFTGSTKSVLYLDDMELITAILR